MARKSTQQIIVTAHVIGFNSKQATVKSDAEMSAWISRTLAEYEANGVSEYKVQLSHCKI